MTIWGSNTDGDGDHASREALPACVINKVRLAFPNTQCDWDIIKQVAGLSGEDWMDRAREWEDARREGLLAGW